MGTTSSGPCRPTSHAHGVKSAGGGSVLLPPPAGRGGGLVKLSFLGLLVSCASADPEALYARGMAASRKKDWPAAEKDLESYLGQHCFEHAPDGSCREAALTLARGFEDQSRWPEAWAALDNALGFPPHAKDAEVKERAEGLAAKVAEGLPTSLDGGTPLLLRYRDESPEGFWVRSAGLWVDGQAVFTKDKGAQDLRSDDWTRAYQATMPPGGHTLVAETFYACKPGQGNQCTAGRARRAWAFHADPHVPLTLDIHAVVRSAEGGGDAARARLEMQRH